VQIVINIGEHTDTPGATPATKTKLAAGGGARAGSDGGAAPTLAASLLGQSTAVASLAMPKDAANDGGSATGSTTTMPTVWPYATDSLAAHDGGSALERPAPST
jgi:hypothetical protein